MKKKICTCIPNSKIQIYKYIYIYIYIYIYVYIHIYSSQKRCCGWDDTRKALTWLYFHYGAFEIKIKNLNLKKAKPVVLKIW